MHIEFLKRLITDSNHQILKHNKWSSNPTLYFNEQINEMANPEINTNTHGKGYMVKRKRWGTK